MLLGGFFGHGVPLFWMGSPAVRDNGASSATMEGSRDPIHTGNIGGRTPSTSFIKASGYAVDDP